MPSTLDAAWAALAALVFWTAVAYPLLRRCLPHATALPFAPIAGWAIHSVIALPLFYAIPFTRLDVGLVAVIALIAAWSIARFDRSSRASRYPSSDASREVRIPRTAWLAAFVVAAICAAAILPKHVDGAIFLSDAIFDHSKVSMIDEMARSGLPPINPYIEHDGGSGRLAYYYLLHFSGAELVVLFGVDGWEADIAMTFFAVFTSLAAMMAIAVRFGERASAAWWVALFAISDSARRVLIDVFGAGPVDRWLQPPGGFQGWLFQTSWVPQHLASTTCVLLALMLMIRLGERPALLPALVLGLVVAAGFESSTWVGGVVFAVCAAVVVPWLMWCSTRRARFATVLAVAGALALLFAWPFIVAQLGASSARHAGLPIALQPQEVIGDAMTAKLRALFDLPAFWLLMLPVEIGAAYVIGIGALITTLRRRASTDRTAIVALATATVAALGCAWLLVSTLAVNNDLGWRAMLLASCLLIVFAGIGMARWIEARRWWPIGIALAFFAAGFPETIAQAQRDVAGHRKDDSALFAAAPTLWARVRDFAGVDDRIANNPLAMRSLTPWPINLPWSLLADRRSCYATWELTQVFSSIPHDRLHAIDDQFVRVFAGRGDAGDVRDLATVYDCRVIVVTPEDGAWSHDPFRDSPWYELVDEQADRWRIYRRRP
jgi:hypothetical protein